MKSLEYKYALFFSSSPSVRGFVHESPLHTRGEPCSPSSSESRLFHLLQNPVGTFEYDLFCLVPVSLRGGREGGREEGEDTRDKESDKAGSDNRGRKRVRGENRRKLKLEERKHKCTVCTVKRRMTLEE